jgi:hypothetical protein
VRLYATDAALLTMLLDLLPDLPPGDTLILVAADTRLMRSGAAKGLAHSTLKPLPPLTCPYSSTLCRFDRLLEEARPWS